MPKGHTDKPQRWDKKEDAICCVVCELPFVQSDLVFNDSVATVHVRCGEAYRKMKAEIQDQEPPF
jgi:hypothetical protein